MSKHKFTYAQKYALWRAYDMECFYCERPLDFKHVTIDHVVPEYLESHPLEYQRIQSEYILEESFPRFSINDFCNWVPSDGPGCNFRKGETLLPKKVTLFYLSQVEKKLPKVAEELKRLTHNRRQGRIIGELSVALENNTISIQHVLEVLNQMEYERTKGKPLIITLGLNTDEVLASRTLPEKAIESYANLCDWLENELAEKLRVLTSYSFHYTEESARSGETLSVRLVFPELSFEERNKLNLYAIEQALPWWEVLEVTNFFQVYETTYQESFPD